MTGEKTFYEAITMGPRKGPFCFGKHYINHKNIKEVDHEL